MAWPAQGCAHAQRPGHRGVLVGPAAAEALVNFWLDDAPISPEMRPDRFKSVRHVSQTELFLTLAVCRLRARA